jgi:hypothetical protein
MFKKRMQKPGWVWIIVIFFSLEVIVMTTPSFLLDYAPITLDCHPLLVIGQELQVDMSQLPCNTMTH